MTAIGSRGSDNSRPVYSTDGGRVKDERAKPQPTGPPSDGVVRVARSTAGRRGKTVTLVTGLPPGDVDAVARELKRLCGSGGAVKDGVAEIQGEHRQKIADHLGTRYRVKIAGG
jgi:translation initiation factor 1